MKLVLIIFLGMLINVSPAFAQKVYLLTSLKVDKKPILARENWDYNLKLENIFKKKTSDFEYEIEVRHKVTPFQLQNILKDENTIGVFWVSHGRSDAIKDMYGNDIKTLFLNLNKNMRFLGVISCNGNFVLKELEDLGLKQKYPNLITLGDNSKVSGAHFLRKSIKVFRYFKNIEGFRNEIPLKYAKKSIVVTRKLLVDSKEISITLDDRFILGVFPAGKLGEIQAVEVEYNQFIEDKLNRHDIVLKRNFKVMTKAEFGDISIHSQYLEGNWELFALPNGLPIGRSALFEYVD